MPLSQRTSGAQHSRSSVHFTRCWSRRSRPIRFGQKHNRRSAKALFEQIKTRGYDGGYSQVTAFTRSWRGEQGKSLRAFVPLTFALGEAFQFDWSEEGLLMGGLFRCI